MTAKAWLPVIGIGLVLLWLANSCENLTIRNRVKLAVGDSLAHAQTVALDKAVSAYRGDAIRLTAQLDSLKRQGTRVRVVTIARVDALREALPDTLQPILDNIVAGFTAQLAAKDSAFALVSLRLAAAEGLLRRTQDVALLWETQSAKWRREATRWRLKIGPFTVRPGVCYLPVTQQGVGAGVCLTP